MADGRARKPGRPEKCAIRDPAMLDIIPRWRSQSTMVPILAFALSALLAARHNVWFIDGNNLMASRGVPPTREAVFDKLQNIKRSTVILVFDAGRDDKTSNEDWNDSKTFCTVVTDQDVSADDYILDTMGHYVSKKQKIHVVTADRELRKQVLARNDVDSIVVNPVTFWRRYRPRLTGLKK